MLVQISHTRLWTKYVGGPGRVWLDPDHIWAGSPLAPSNLARPHGNIQGPQRRARGNRGLVPEWVAPCAGNPDNGIDGQYQSSALMCVCNLSEQRCCAVTDVSVLHRGTKEDGQKYPNYCNEGSQMAAMKGRVGVGRTRWNPPAPHTLNEHTKPNQCGLNT